MRKIIILITALCLLLFAAAQTSQPASQTLTEDQIQAMMRERGINFVSTGQELMLVGNNIFHPNTRNYIDVNSKFPGGTEIISKADGIIVRVLENQVGSLPHGKYKVEIADGKSSNLGDIKIVSTPDKKAANLEFDEGRIILKKGSKIEVDGIPISATEDDVIIGERVLGENYYLKDVDGIHFYGNGFGVGLGKREHIPLNNKDEDREHGIDPKDLETTIAPYLFRRDTVLQDHSPDVSKLQAFLKRRGLYHENIDGDLGPATTEALANFQREIGLLSTGELDPVTIEKINIRAANLFPDSEYMGAKRGDEGQKMIKLQEFLADEGVFDARTAPNFGPKTEEAVKSFQRKYDIEDSGIVDEETLDIMNLIQGGYIRSNNLNVVDVESDVSILGIEDGFMTITKNRIPTIPVETNKGLIFTRAGKDISMEHVYVKDSENPLRMAPIITINNDVQIEKVEFGGTSEEKIEIFKTFIEPHERIMSKAIPLKAYLDTAKPPNPTIGIGFNLNRGDARKRLAEVGANYDRVRAGQDTITREQAYQLYEYTVEEAVGKAKKYFDNYDELPVQAQKVLVDMCFNIRKFHTWHNFQDAIESWDFNRAANIMDCSLWKTQVKGRATNDNIPIMRELAKTHQR